MPQWCQPRPYIKARALAPYLVHDSPKWCNIRHCIAAYIIEKGDATKADADGRTQRKRGKQTKRGNIARDVARRNEKETEKRERETDDGGMMKVSSSIQSVDDGGRTDERARTSKFRSGAQARERRRREIMQMGRDEEKTAWTGPDQSDIN